MILFWNKAVMSERVEEKGEAVVSIWKPFGRILNSSALT